MKRTILVLLGIVVPTVAASAPPGMQCVTGTNGPAYFYIDKYEASLDSSGAAVSVVGVAPAVNISQVEAATACALAGKRLCSDREWIAACRGPNDFTYPYGDVEQPDYCNGGPSGTISATGDYPQCATHDQVLDMVGNVGEWTAAVDGTFRGGSFRESTVNGTGCAYVTTAHSANYEDEYTGFRCCLDDDVQDCANAVRQIDIDIKPGSDPNCFNQNGHGVIPVAILGSASFDAAAVDTTGLTFAGLEVRVRGNKGPLCGMDDVNFDGYADLVCHFEDDTANWAANGNGSATLSGQLQDGTAFEGSDAICVVP